MHVKQRDDWKAPESPQGAAMHAAEAEARSFDDPPPGGTDPGTNAGKDFPPPKECDFDAGTGGKTDDGHKADGDFPPPYEGDFTEDSGGHVDPGQKAEPDFPPPSEG